MGLLHLFYSMTYVLCGQRTMTDGGRQKSDDTGGAVCVLIELPSLWK